MRTSETIYVVGHGCTGSRPRNPWVSVSGVQPATGMILRRFEEPDIYIPPEPHDSWVVGEQPYVSLHFLGADHYAK
jgi:hypothetical protein